MTAPEVYAYVSTSHAFLFRSRGSTFPPLFSRSSRSVLVIPFERFRFKLRLAYALFTFVLFLLSRFVPALFLLSLNKHSHWCLDNQLIGYVSRPSQKRSGKLLCIARDWGWPTWRPRGFRTKAKEYVHTVSKKSRQKHEIRQIQYFSRFQQRRKRRRQTKYADLRKPTRFHLTSYHVRGSIRFATFYVTSCMSLCKVPHSVRILMSIL